MKELIIFLEKIPSIKKPISFNMEEDGNWWIKFSIDINNKYAWIVVQEFGHIINYLSVNEKLPTIFYPVSPPPYLNGGPEEFLSWVIETRNKEFKPDLLLEWLEGRLPNPVDDLSQWAEE